MAVLYPTLGLFNAFLRDAEWAVVLCRAYNTMLYKEVTSVSPRLKGVALLPLQDPQAAADELRRAVRELGLVGGMLAADGYYLLGHQRFDPIYAAAQELGVPVAVHAGGTDMGVAGHEPFPKFIQAHAVSHVFAQLRQITSVMFDAVPVRFPRLKIAFLEAGSGWIPFFLQRLDEEWEKRGHAEAKLLTKSPTEYVRGGNIYFSCEADEPLLPQALAYVGADRIMYASDFPHWDHSYPKSVKELADRADVTDAQKASVFAGTARRFYDLK
jgi:predicted TIM-barrel fold metal-dependent hydrolase